MHHTLHVLIASLLFSVALPIAAVANTSEARQDTVDVVRYHEQQLPLSSEVNRAPVSARHTLLGQSPYELQSVPDNVVQNGRFIDSDTGLEGWEIYNEPAGNQGSWYVQEGMASPLAGWPVAPPTAGTQAAMTDQLEEGLHILYQDIDVPADEATISLDYYVNNRPGQWAVPASNPLEVTGADNQHIRIDLIDPNADITSAASSDICDSVYVTNPEDDDLVFGYVSRVQAISEDCLGKTVRLRLVAVSNIGYMNFGVDNVSVTPGGPPTNLNLTFQEIVADDFPEVTANVLAADDQGTPITGLTQASFVVSEDNFDVDISEVQTFQEAGGAVSVALAIDRSGSMSGQALTDAKEAATSFVQQLDYSAGDEGAIVSYARDVTIDQPFTDDVSLLEDAIAGLNAGGNTALYDAIVESLDITSGQAGSKAVIAMTDGKNNNSSNSVQDIIDKADITGIPVYTIGFGSVDQSVLETIAEETGGEFYVAPTSGDLDQIYQLISQQIRNRYSITYTAQKNGASFGSTRRVKVVADLGVEGSDVTGEDERTYDAPDSDLKLAIDAPSGDVTLGPGSFQRYTMTVLTPFDEPVEGVIVDVQNGVASASFSTEPTNDAGETSYLLEVPGDVTDPGPYTISFQARGANGFNESTDVSSLVEIDPSERPTVEGPAIVVNVSYDDGRSVEGHEVWLREPLRGFPPPKSSKGLVNASGYAIFETLPSSLGTCARNPFDDIIEEILLYDNNGEKIYFSKLVFDCSDRVNNRILNLSVKIFTDENIQPNEDEIQKGWRYYEDRVYPASLTIQTDNEIDSQAQPVIFVHGIGGQHPYWYQGQRTGSVVESIDSDRRYQAWEFYYPYDQEINKSSLLLKEAIKNILLNYETANADLIAHSMGGLVARDYIQSDQYDNNVGGLLMLGTPNNGSFGAWRSGYSEGITGKVSGFKLDRYSPGIRQLNPFSSFLVDLNNTSGRLTSRLSNVSSVIGEDKSGYSYFGLERLHTEIRDQEDGVVSVSSTNMLSAGVELVITDLNHSEVADESESYVKQFLDEGEIGSCSGIDGCVNVISDPNDALPYSEGMLGLRIQEPDVSIRSDEYTVMCADVDDNIVRLGSSGNCTAGFVPALDKTSLFYLDNGDVKLLTGFSGTYAFSNPLAFFIGLDLDKDIARSMGFGAPEGTYALEFVLPVDLAPPSGGSIGLPNQSLPFARAEGFTFKPGQANFWNADLTEAERSIFAADAFVFAEPEEPATLLASSSASDAQATTTQAYSLFADSAMESLTVWLSGFEAQPGNAVELTLTSPSGNTIDSGVAETEDAVTYGGGAEQGFAYLYIRDPEPGEWRVSHSSDVADGELLAPVIGPISVSVASDSSVGEFEPGTELSFAVEAATDAICTAPEVTAEGFRTSPGRSSRVSLGTLPLQPQGEQLRGAIVPDRPGQYTVAATLTCAGTDPVIRRTTASSIGTVVRPGGPPPSDAAPPQLERQIEDQSLIAWTETFRQNLSNVFAPTDGGVLSYEVKSSHPQAVRVAVEGNEMVVEPVGEGQARVLVTAEADNGLFTETQFNVQVPAFPVSTQRSFTDATDIRSYRLLALPGDVDVDIAATLEGEQGDAWRAFWEQGARDGADPQSIVEYDSTDTFRFRPGRGFWLLGTSEWQYEDVVDALLPDEEDQIEIPVHRGWNIVSNPRSVDVPWNAIQEKNGVSEALWRWDGGWQRVQTLLSARSGEAFYYYHEAQEDSLTIPGADRAAPVAGIEEEQEEKAISVYARIDSGNSDVNSRSSRVTVGYTTGEPVKDRLPPAHFTVAQLVAYSEERPHRSGRLVTNAPENNDGLSFDLALTGIAEGEVAYLHPKGLSAFEGDHVVLVNTASGARHDLTSFSAEDPLRIRVEEGHLVDNEYTAERALPLQLLVGDESFIASTAERPEALAFGPVYPNPSRAEVTITVAVPEAMDVQVELFNVLGQQVGLLHHGELAPGVHEIAWDGRTASGAAAASGVYLLRLTGPEGQHDTARLTRLR